MAASNDPRQVLQIFIQPNEIWAFPDNDLAAMKRIECPNIMAIGANISQRLKSYKLFPRKQFKAATFIFHEHPFELQEFQRGCQKFCQDKGYFCYFVSLWELSLHAALFHTKMMVPQNDKVLICYIHENILEFRVCIRRNGFYQLEFSDNYPIWLKNFDVFKTVFNITVNQFDPKKVVIITSAPKTLPRFTKEKKLAEMLRKALMDNYDVIVCDKVPPEIGFDASYANVLNAMGEKKNPYRLKLLVENSFVLAHGKVSVVQEEDMITLPYEKTEKIKVNSRNDCLKLLTSDTKTVETINLDQYYGKEIKVTFKIDMDRFYSISIDPPPAIPKVEPKVADSETKVAESIEKALKISSDSKAKIVFTETDYSIIIPKSGKKKGWKNLVNGKSPLFISFTEAKPIVGEEAKKIFIQKPSFVVYDLLRICSLDASENADSKWPFSIILGANNEIKVKFDTHEGLKASSLPFLMALVFRDCLSRIKKETGEKPNEIEVEIKYEIGISNIKRNFQKAGELMKIAIKFV